MFTPGADARFTHLSLVLEHMPGGNLAKYLKDRSVHNPWTYSTWTRSKGLQLQVPRCCMAARAALQRRGVPCACQLSRLVAAAHTSCLGAVRLGARQSLCKSCLALLANQKGRCCWHMRDAAVLLTDE